MTQTHPIANVKFILAIVLSILFALYIAKLWPTEAKVDAESGLVIGPGYKLVDAYCIGCHTAQMISQHGATHAGWAHIVRRMQKIGEWTLDPTTEAEIIRYLSKNYPAKTTGRN